MKNLPQMQQLLGDDDEEAEFSSCCQLIETSPVQILKKTTPTGQPAFPEDMLCRKGKASPCSFLILSGKVGLTSIDGQSYEVGPWTSISPESLVQPFGAYIPDFTAYLVSATLRVVRINVHSEGSSRIPSLEKRMKGLDIWHKKPLTTSPLNTSPNSTQLSPMYQQKTYTSAYGLISSVSSECSLPPSPFDSPKKTRLGLDAIHALDSNNSVDNNIRLNNGVIDQGRVNISNKKSDSITRIHINDNNDNSSESFNMDHESKPLVDITLNPLMGLRASPLETPSLENPLNDKRIYPDTISNKSFGHFESKSGNNRL
jgi:hypothetical protein